MSEQQQFKKQVAKEGFQSANAEYIGLTEKPKTGKKGDKEWRKVKLNFKLEGKDKENKFVLWTPINSDKSKYKSDEELTQFETYNIVWVEKEEKFGDKEWVSKTITNINGKKDSTEQSNVPKQGDNQTQVQTTHVQETPLKTDKLYPLSKFTKIYIDKMAKNVFKGTDLFHYIKLYAKVNQKEGNTVLFTEDLLVALKTIYDKQIHDTDALE